MKKLIVAVGMMAMGLAAVSAETEAVTLEGLQKEIRELKAEIRGLRQEMRSGARPQVRHMKWTNDVITVRSKNRIPKDPEARKAWYAERHKAYEEKLKALREKHGAKKADTKPAE